MFRVAAQRLVIAGLIPAISIRKAKCPTIGMAGTSPAMTNEESPASFALLTPPQQVTARN
jgi:hypothetical protein